MDKLRKLEHTMSQHPYGKKLGKIGTAKYGDFIVLKGAIMRERTYIQWLEECIEEMRSGLLKNH